MTQEQEDIFNKYCAEGKLDEARAFLKKVGEAKQADPALCKVDDPTCESCAG